MNWYLAIKYYISKRPRQVVIRSHIPTYRGTAADLDPGPWGPRVQSCDV